MEDRMKLAVFTKGKEVGEIKRRFVVKSGCKKLLNKDQTPCR